LKLYGVRLSPYVSRARMVIYVKGLEVELLDPPVAMGTPEWRSISPTGKIPALETETGIIIESQVICEYLDDRFADPALRPADPEGRARVALISRLDDLYLSPFMSILFRNLKPEKRNQDAVDKAFAQVENGLDLLEKYIGEGGFAYGASLTLADCTLVPTLCFAEVLLTLYDKSELLTARPKLAGYWIEIQTETNVARILKEMKEDLSKIFGPK
jgi:glutathione S-transferase